MKPIDFLVTYILSGIPSNAAWDLIKSTYLKATDKSWEEKYLEAFHNAVEQQWKHLETLSDSKEILFEQATLRKALEQSIDINPESWTLWKLKDEEFSKKLTKALAKKSALIIGGHQLNEKDYENIILSLIQNVRSILVNKIQSNEDDFRKFVVDEFEHIQLLLKSNRNAIKDISD